MDTIKKVSKDLQLGEILDPIADKILLIFIFFGLANLLLFNRIYGFHNNCREIWVSALALNSRNNNLAATKVTYLAKIKTSIQFITIFVYLIASIKHNVIHCYCRYFTNNFNVITLYTGYNYTFNTFIINSTFIKYIYNMNSQLKADGRVVTAARKAVYAGSIPASASNSKYTNTKV